MAKRFLEACATWLPGRGRNIPLILAGNWLHLLQEGSGGSIGCPGVGGRGFRVGQCLGFMENCQTQPGLLAFCQT